MTPIPLKNRLAPQPSKAPRFSVFLETKDGRELALSDPRAVRALIACMNVSAIMGGAAAHWGGPSAFAELTSALFALVFDEADRLNIPYFERYRLLNDAGHCENGLYALKANYGMAGLTAEELKGFRSLKSRLTGHGEAHLFPEAVFLSNGPLGSVLPQAQGLALADRLQKKERMCVVTASDGALMEGEAKEALAAVPGFAGKNRLSPFLLIVSDNNKKLSGPIDSDSYSLRPTLEALSVLGWETIFLPAGNSLSCALGAVRGALKKAWANPRKPVALWAKTIKGFGVRATEESSSGGHGFPLKDPKLLRAFIEEIYGDAPVPEEISAFCRELENQSQQKNARAAAQAASATASAAASRTGGGGKTPPLPPPLQKTQEGVRRALTEQKRKGLPLVSVTSDLFGSTGLAEFRKLFPESSFDVGVAEANMISAAAGFSKAGFIPVTDTFAQFAVTKGALPLIMSALSEAPVIGVFSHAGFQDAADGASHQALSYLAKTCSLPRTKVYVLSCAEEAYHLISQTAETFYKQRKAGAVPPSSLFFLGRETFPPALGDPPPKDYSLDRAQVLFDGSKGEKPVLIVSCGPLVQEALFAAKELQKQGRGAVVINNPLVSDPDGETLSARLEVCGGRLLTVEEHQLKGGFGDRIATALLERGARLKVFRPLGVKGGFGRSAYKARDLYQLFGIDRGAVAAAALSLA